VFDVSNIHDNNQKITQNYFFEQEYFFSLNLRTYHYLVFDPQAAALLQQAGLMLSEDGTVQSIGNAEVNALDASASAGVPQELLLTNATEGELAETTTNNETNVPKHEPITLPSAPDPNVRSKDIIEESLAQSQFGTDDQALEIPESNPPPAVTTAVTTQQLNFSQTQETITQQPLQTQPGHQPQVQQQRPATSVVSTSLTQN
jgi:hypothetical protein